MEVTRIELYINYRFNLISFLATIFVLIVIVSFAYRLYKNQEKKPKKWAVLLTILIGLFSFSIKFEVLGTVIDIPILLLGVWLLYFIYMGKEGRWQRYRTYAWLGFGANFLFVIAQIAAIPIHQIVYPADDANTYISDIEDGAIVTIHAASSQTTQLKNGLENQLDSMIQEEKSIYEWYGDGSIQPSERTEQFPYQLINTKAKWGSGYKPIIFIEEDGKGMLISTSNEQVYFRSEDSLVEGVK
jgi:hypothetical protein